MILVYVGIYKVDCYNYCNEYVFIFYGIYSLIYDGILEWLIVIKVVGDGVAIFDGDGVYCLFDFMVVDYYYFEGLIIRNVDIGILVGEKNVFGCEGFVVKNCWIENVGIGIMV